MDCGDRRGAKATAAPGQSALVEGLCLRRGSTTLTSRRRQKMRNPPALMRNLSAAQDVHPGQGNAHPGPKSGSRMRKRMGGMRMLASDSGTRCASRPTFCRSWTRIPGQDVHPPWPGCTSYARGQDAQKSWGLAHLFRRRGVDKVTDLRPGRMRNQPGRCG